MPEPEIDETEFYLELDEVAKDAIRDYLVQDDGRIKENPALAAGEEGYAGGLDEHPFVAAYPIALETYVSDASFHVDDHERLSSSSPKEVIQLARTRLFQSALEERVEKLLDGHWTAVREKSETVVEEVEVGDEQKRVEGEESYLVLDE